MGRWDVGSLDVLVVVWLGISRMNKNRAVEQRGFSTCLFFLSFSAGCKWLWMANACMTGLIEHMAPEPDGTVFPRYLPGISSVLGYFASS